MSINSLLLLNRLRKYFDSYKPRHADLTKEFNRVVGDLRNLNRAPGTIMVGGGTVGGAIDATFPRVGGVSVSGSTDAIGGGVGFSVGIHLKDIGPTGEYIEISPGNIEKGYSVDTKFFTGTMISNEYGQVIVKLDAKVQFFKISPTTGIEYVFSDVDALVKNQYSSWASDIADEMDIVFDAAVKSRLANAVVESYRLGQNAFDVPNFMRVEEYRQKHPTGYGNFESSDNDNYSVTRLENGKYILRKTYYTGQQNPYGYVEELYNSRGVKIAEREQQIRPGSDIPFYKFNEGRWVSAATSGNQVEMQQLYNNKFEHFFDNKCFAAGTLVRMWDATEKSIDLLRVGDRVCAVDNSGKNLTPGIVEAVHKNVSSKALRLDDGTVVTADHPFLSEDGKYYPISIAIDLGIKIVRSSGAGVLEISVAPEVVDSQVECDTYNITVRDHHTYIANGWVVHNTSLVDYLPNDSRVYVERTEVGPDGTSYIIARGPDGEEIVIAGKDLAENGTTDPIYQRISTGTSTTERLWFDEDHDDVLDLVRITTSAGGIGVSVDREVDIVDGKAIAGDRRADTVVYRGIDVGAIGQIFGSVIGASLSDNDLTSAVGSVVFGAIGANLAEQIVGRSIELSKGQAAVGAGIGNAFEDLGADIRDAARGAISSYLAAELVRALGVDGPIGGLLASTGGAAISQIASNLSALASNPAATWLDPATGLEVQRSWSSGVTSAMGSAAGAFAGAWLASKLVQFDAIHGQIGAALGSSVGSLVGVAAAADGMLLGMQLGSWAGPVGAFIGAFVGYIAGGLIGSLAGKPKSYATVSWSEEDDKFGVTNVHSKRSGDKDAAVALADAVAKTLNFTLEATGAQLRGPNNIRPGVYGMRGKDYIYWPASAMFTSNDPSVIINHGAFLGLSDMIPSLVGGDVYIKRALNASLKLSGGDASDINNQLAAGSFSVEGLVGDIALAGNFRDYLAAPDIVDALIAADPSTEFAAGWILTFARADELGILRRAVTDWSGGFNAQFDVINDQKFDGNGVFPSNVELSWDELDHSRSFWYYDSDGYLLEFIPDTVRSHDKDVIFDIDNVNYIDHRAVNGLALEDADLFEINGVQGQGDHYLPKVAAVIDAGEGDDTVYAGDLGNDVLGGAGNDTIVGGKLDDWLFGEDGNDILRSSDPAGHSPSAYLGGGSNGDYLDGGAGNDQLHGDYGSQWLAGGEGNDAILAWQGGDIIDGGAGVDALYGQEGSDQYLFGLGDGADYVYDDGNAPVTVTVNPTTGAIQTSVTQVLTDLLKGRLDGLNNLTVTANWLGNSVDPNAGGDLANGAVADSVNPEDALPTWARSGDYEINGDVKGGEDAIVFKAGIGMGDLFMQRGGTVVGGVTVPGDSDDLVIQLLNPDSERNIPDDLTGDILIVQNWFASSLTRVEWLRFADGEEIRIGDAVSIINGTNGPDTLIGTAGNDFIYGYDGDDSLAGLAGADVLNAGRGRDYASGGTGNDWVIGGMDDDKVFGDEGADYVFGDSGNDFVYGGAGNDRIIGGKGDDRIVTGAGDDLVTYRRGDGKDVITDEIESSDWEVVWRQTLNASGNPVSASYMSGYALQLDGTITGPSDSSPWSGDRKTYFDGQNWIGDYYLDLEFDGSGNLVARNYKRYIGGALRFNETDNPYSGWRPTPGVTNAGTDTVQFGVGIDLQDLMLTWDGQNYIWAISDENSIASFDSIEDKITVSTIPGTSVPIENFVFNATGWLQLSTVLLSPWLQTEFNDYINVIFGNTPAWVTGLAGDDVILTGNGADFIVGGAGSDDIMAYDGDDKIWGGAGDDLINGGAGNDIIMGGEGYDIVSYAGGSAVTINLSTGAAGGDQLFGIEGVEGSASADTITGNTGDNVLRGGGGNDTLAGGAGSDTYEWNGGDGRDTITDTGGAADVLEIGEGFSLSDLTFTRSGANVTLKVSGSNAVTINNQTVAGSAIETLALRDGLTAALTTLRLVGESGTSGLDFMVGDATADTFSGGDGDDVLSGVGGADVLHGDGGNDILEGGAGADVLDGGWDAVSLGQAPMGSAAYGDTVRYVRSGAAVQVDLAANTFAGGEAAGDTATAYMSGRSAAPYNGLRYSQDLNQGDWYAWNTTVTADAGAAPDGTTTADKVVASTANDWHDVSQEFIALTPGGYYTASTYVKSAGLTRGALYLEGGSGDKILAYFDLITGTITATEAEGAALIAGAAIAPAGNGYYRVTMTGRLDSASKEAMLHLTLGEDSFEGDGTSGLYFWGSQIAAGFDAGVYTPTQAQAEIPIQFIKNAALMSQALDHWAWWQWNSTVVADAAVAPDGTTTADKLVESTQNNYHIAGQGGIQIKAGEVNTVSLYVKAAGATTGSVRLEADNGSDAILCEYNLTTGQITYSAGTGAGVLSSATITAAANGYYRITLSGKIDNTSAAGQLVLSVGDDAHQGNGSSGLYIWGAQVEPGATASAYVPTTLAPAVGGVTATATVKNLVLNSQGLENWYAGNLAVAADAAMAPDGSATADKLTANTTTGWHDAYQGWVPITAGQVYTYSTYVKAAGATTGALRFEGENAADGVFCTFDLATGQVTSSGAEGAAVLSGVSITAADNGFYRVTVSGKTDNTSVFGAVHLILGTSAHAGDGISGLYFWGSQLEPGATAGAYVATTAWRAMGFSPTGGDVYSTIENVWGSDVYGDTLSGDARANRLWGGGGHDILSGRDGADVLDGGSGNDTLNGGDDADAIAGSLGNDQIYGDKGADILDGGDGNDTIYGDTDRTTTTGAGADQLIGGAGNDTLYGGAGNDVVSGGEGNDGVYGDAGDDQLSGGAGADSFYGGDGNDVLSGDAGNDVLRGENGDDTYVVAATDGWDTLTDTVGTNNKVQFTGTTNDKIWFYRVNNDLRIGVIGGDSTVVLTNYYASSSKTLIKSVEAGGYILFLKYAQPLLDAMSSGGTPAAMPQAIQDMLADYWRLGNKAAPTTEAERAFTIDEDYDLVDQLVAVDFDENIPLTGAYTIDTQATKGTVTITDTGAYTYHPNTDVTGEDSFVVKVTDADGQSALQRVTVTIAPVNDAPREVVFTPTAGAAIERNNPAADQVLPVQVLGLLSAQDDDGPASNLVALDYTVSDSRFVVVDTGSGPALALKAGEAFDFEADPTVTLSITATDSHFNKVLHSEDLTAWSAVAYPATITADQAAGPDGLTKLDKVLAPSAGGAASTARHAAFQAVAGAVAGTQYTLSFYARANGTSKYLWIGDTGDFVTGSTTNTQWNTAAFDLSGSGAVRAKNSNVSSATIEHHGSGLYRVSITFVRDTSGNFQIAAGPDRASSSLVSNGQNYVDGWAGAGESIFVGYAQLETGASKSGYAPSSDTTGVISVTTDVTITVIDQDDYIYGDNTAETIDGGASRDLIHGAGGNDALTGLGGHDDLYGEIGDDSLLGGQGDDKLYGGAGDDLLDGGDGIDLLEGGQGNDRLFGGQGNDSLLGGEGDDYLLGGAGVDTLNGGSGSDFASYEDSGAAGLTVSLLTPASNTGLAAGDVFVTEVVGGVTRNTIENLRLSDGADIGSGDNEANVLIGAAGNDTLNGNGGEDVLYGDDGVDTINGGDGADLIYGDVLNGDGFADALNGGNGDDSIFGYAGADTIHGDAGSDLLYGGDGNDTIYGDAGDDRIWGGAGNDSLRGGEGSDTYLIDTDSGSDTVIETDAQGDDVDVLGYQDNIGREYLWFQKSGNNLVISVIGTNVATTLQDWYLTQTAPANVKLEYVVAGTNVTQSVNAEALVTLMAGYTKPTTRSAYDALHANSSFQTPWLALWGGNSAPAIAAITSQTVSEDGVVTVSYSISDDISNASVVMSATSPDGTIYNIVQPGAAGTGTFDFRPHVNYSGSTTITLTATDPGGLTSETQVAVTVTPVVDAPHLDDLPNMAGTLDAGPMSLVVPAALSDGTESLQVRISGLATKTLATTPFGASTPAGNAQFLDGINFTSNTSSSGAFDALQYDFGASKFVAAVQLDGARWTGAGGTATVQVYGSLDGVSWTSVATYNLSGAATQNTGATAVNANFRYMKLTPTAYSGAGQLVIDRLQAAGRASVADAVLQQPGTAVHVYSNPAPASNAANLDGAYFVSRTSTGSAFDALKYDLGAGKSVSSVRLEGARWIDGASGAAIVQIYGSNDNTNWTSLATHSLSGGSDQTFSQVNVNAGYRYLKVSPTSFTANGQLSIDQLQVNGYATANIQYGAALQNNATATSTTVYTTYSPNNAKAQDGSYYISNWGYGYNAPNLNIQYDLGAVRSLAGFTVDGTYWADGASGWAALKIKGSVDNVNWVDLNSFTLYGSSLQNKSGGLSGSYRYVALQSTSSDYGGYLYVDRFQVTGTIIPADSTLQTPAAASAPPFVAPVAESNALALDGNYFISDVSSAATFEAIRFDLGAAKWISSVQLDGTKWADGASGVANVPLYGSTDGVNWTLITTYALSGTGFQDKPAIAVNGVYRYLQLSPTGVANTGQLYVDRLQVLGYDAAGLPSNGALQAESDLSLNHGVYDPLTGVWTVDGEDLADLALEGPATAAEEMVLKVEAVSTEPGASPSTASVSETFNLSLNAAPTSVGSSGGLTLSLAEKSSGTLAWAEGTRVADLTVTDPDGASDGHVFVLTDDGGGRFKAAFNSTTQKWELQVKNGLLLDYEDVPNRTIPVTVQVTDAGGLSRSQVVSIQLTNLNDSIPVAPSEVALTGPSQARLFILGESASYVGFDRITKLTSSDADGTAPTLSIVSGTDPWGLFTIVNSEVRLSNPNMSFDFDYRAGQGLPSNVTFTDLDQDGYKELKYTLKVVASDGTFTSAQSDIAVYFEDANEAPYFGSSSYTFYVNQTALSGSPNPVVIGNIGVPYDPDWDPNHRNVVPYLYGNGANSAFGYNSANGQITYMAAVGGGTYNLAARAADHNGSGAWTDSAVNIVVDGAPIMGATTYGTDYYDPWAGVSYTHYDTVVFYASDENVGALQWYVDATGLSYDSSGGMFAPPANGHIATGVNFGRTIKQWGYWTAGGTFDYTTNYTIQLSVYDTAGQRTQHTYSIANGGVSFVAPIIFNLEDAPEGVMDQPVVAPFAAQAGGEKTPVSWINSRQGLLFLDRNANGLVDDGSEISFTQDKPGAKSDLEGLAAFDSNLDRVFDAGDDRFSEFRIWRDHDADGVSDEGEILTFAQAGVVSLALDGVLTGKTLENASDTIVHAVTTFTRTDGTQGVALDAMIASHDPAQVELIAAVTDSQTVADRVELEGGGSVAHPVDLGGPVGLARLATAQGDAVLVFDQNRNGRIDDVSEIAFSGGLTGAGDLAKGLERYDLNKDGVFDQADAGYKHFGLWRDADGDGAVDEGELRSLAGAGVDKLRLAETGVEAILVDGDAKAVQSETVALGDLPVLGLSEAVADPDDDHAGILIPDDLSVVDPQVSDEESPGAGPTPEPTGQAPDHVYGSPAPPVQDISGPPPIVEGSQLAPTEVPPAEETESVATPPVAEEQDSAPEAVQAPPVEIEPIAPSTLVAPPTPVEGEAAAPDQGEAALAVSTPNEVDVAPLTDGSASPEAGPQDEDLVSGAEGSVDEIPVGPDLPPVMEEDDVEPAPAPIPASDEVQRVADAFLADAELESEASPSQQIVNDAYMRLSLSGVDGTLAAKALDASLRRLQACGYAASELAVKDGLALLGPAGSDAEAVLRDMVGELAALAKPTHDEPESASDLAIQSALDSMASKGVTLAKAYDMVNASLEILRNCGAAAVELAVRKGLEKSAADPFADPAATEEALRTMVRSVIAASDTGPKEEKETSPAQQLVQSAFENLTASGVYMADASAALDAAIKALDGQGKDRAAAKEAAMTALLQKGEAPEGARKAVDFMVDQLAAIQAFEHKLARRMQAVGVLKEEAKQDLESWRQSALTALRSLSNAPAGPGAAHKAADTAGPGEGALPDVWEAVAAAETPAPSDYRWGAGAPRVSALDAGLSVSERHRILMVQAIAAFTPGPAGALIDQTSRLRDPQAAALLTALPDVRVA